MDTMRAKGNKWACLSIMVYYGLACVLRKGGRKDSQPARQKLLLDGCNHRWPAISCIRFGFSIAFSLTHKRKIVHSSRLQTAKTA